MKLSEALEQVKMKTGTELDLKATLLFGEVRARSLKFIDSEFEGRRDGYSILTDSINWLPNLFWEHADVDWDKNTASVYCADESPRYKQTHFYVHVYTADIQRLWPADPATSPEVRETKRGGRPATYDWAAAGAFLAAWQTANGKPERSAALSNALQQFFERLGKVPDDREINRFVAKYLSEYEREMRKES